jgi:hypothetical protein
MKVTGKIEKILDTATGTSKAGKEWKKTSFLLKTDEEYNNLYCFDVFGGEKVDNFLQWNAKGDIVEVDFNVRTNEWKDKYFTSLEAWKVFKANTNEINEGVEQVANESDLPF